MFDAALDGWMHTTLGAIASVGGGTTPSKAEPGYWDNGSVPWATPSDITSLPNGIRRISETAAMVSDRALSECSLPLNPAGTVLMTSRATIGYVAINDVPMTTNQGFITFRCNERSDPDFLLQWLVANRGLLVSAAGGSTFKELGRGTAKLLPIFLPPIDEQRRIAEVLISLDITIQNTQRVMEQSLKCLNASLTALMRQGILGQSDSGGDGSSPVGWTEDRCDHFFVLQRGFDITEKQSRPGTFEVISSSGPSYFHDEAAVDGPAVITGRKGRLGTVFYSDRPCWPHDTTLWVKDFKGNLPRFVFWKLREMKLEAYDAATSVPTLNRNNVHALTVRFPPLDEQQEIVEILDAEWNAIEREEAYFNRLNSIREAVASDLLTGRVRVPV